MLIDDKLAIVKLIFQAKTEFPEVFQTLGSLPDEYIVCMAEDATPHAISVS